MIQHDAFLVEPWCLREKHCDIDVLPQTESLFALANGHIGWRANLDEGEPHGLPGTYLNGMFEQWPLPYAEDGYGNPESGQTMINVTNGKVIRLLVDDEPFDIRYGELRAHERVLDFRAGTLSRSAEWVSPAGRTVRVTSERLVSFTQRAVAAINYRVEAVGDPVEVVLQSELVANEQLPPSDGDPRVAAVLEAPLQAEDHDAVDGEALLMHTTRRSGLGMAAAMRHIVVCPAPTRQTSEIEPDIARFTVTARLQPGESMNLVKFVAYGWSGVRSRPALRDQVAGALGEAFAAGWSGLVAEQRKYLDDFWAQADVELDGDPEVQQAVRFGLFHVLQAGARAEGRAIPAKGLTGTGYDGHAFWDTETFVLPVLTATAPDAVAAALRWRYSILDMAIDRAHQLGLAGAAFPWRTIGGEECSGYWPAGTAAFHVNADIADAVLRYVDSTGDVGFEETVGLELLVHTARLWCALGHYDAGSWFRIDGVTGPDEYSAVADNNVYTNLMAQVNLRGAAEAAGRYPERAAELGVAQEELKQWRAAADAMVILYDPTLRVHPQAEGFTRHQAWDFAATRADQYPLLTHFPYFDLYRKQVVKQADLVLAMQLCPDAFDEEQKARNFDYYEALTVRDSSLSAPSQAVMAAETGHLDLAYDYLTENALIDIGDLQDNTRDGLHIGALAGSWMVLVCGFGGMRHRPGAMPDFCPHLPAQLAKLTFTLLLRGRRLRVTTGPDTATYELTDEGPPIEIWHYGSPLTVSPGNPQTRSIPALTVRPRPSQPAGREPPLGKMKGNS
ncbi:MAG TPA: glycosyl hydrolase family 65 protein [Streptosporangiaceae bacterium]|jgi:alpha,alpha-trehalose phosphorylase|nr:glycosyl hydrolase family 65 protein [Streptosporangiaceae bacterium]